MIVPGFGFNRLAQRKSLEWIRAEAALAGCAAVLASHDPGISGDVIVL